MSNLTPNTAGLTDADRDRLRVRLASWFGDDRQAFLVSHLAPAVERIKAEAAAEFQWNALEMARRADLAERRAEEAEFHVEQLRDARDRAERRAEAAEAEVERLLDDRECGRCSECQRGQRCTGWGLNEARPLPIHRTEAGYPSCSTCDGGGCYDCTDPA